MLAVESGNLVAWPAITVIRSIAHTVAGTAANGRIVVATSNKRVQWSAASKFARVT